LNKARGAQPGGDGLGKSLVNRGEKFPHFQGMGQKGSHPRGTIGNTIVRRCQRNTKKEGGYDFRRTRKGAKRGEVRLGAM